MSILIVEDNPVSAKIVEFNLQKNGYQTILVQTGREALECLESTPDIQLVITDILMPEMNGLELLGKIKERPEWKEIPVIMCTSLVDVETVKKAAEAGCRHYVIKPIKAIQLFQKIRETLEHEKPILKEKNQVMSELGLDSESYQEIVEVFAILVNDTIDHLEKHIEEGSVSGISINLANISEGASLIGAERVKNILDRLDIQGKRAELKGENLEYPLLLRELKILNGALPSVLPSFNPPPEKEIKDDDTKEHRTQDTQETAPNNRLAGN